MIHLNDTKTLLVAKIGYWSALTCVITFLIFTICLIAIFIVNPVFKWTDLGTYVAFVNKNNQTFKHIAELSMIVFGVSYVILVNSIYDFTSDDKKLPARIGTSFGAIFSALISINYFVQLSAVRLNIMKGQTADIEQFIQSNPTSGMAAINMLGWTVFLGLSSLFISAIFTNNGLEKLIKKSLFANGIICLLGGIGYMLDLTGLVFVCMNLGMGIALLITSISLSIWFKQKTTG